MEQFTFTFDKAELTRFNLIMSRLDPDEYEIVEPIHDVDPVGHERLERQTVMRMDPEAASMFRFGMKGKLIIKRLRSEEEEAERKALEDQHRVKITVKVNNSGEITGVDSDN